MLYVRRNVSGGTSSTSLSGPTQHWLGFLLIHAVFLTCELWHCVRILVLGFPSYQSLYPLCSNLTLSCHSPPLLTPPPPHNLSQHSHRHFPIPPLPSPLTPTSTLFLFPSGFLCLPYVRSYAIISHIYTFNHDCLQGQLYTCTVLIVQ